MATLKTVLNLKLCIKQLPRSGLTIVSLNMMTVHDRPNYTMLSYSGILIHLIYSKLSKLGPYEDGTTECFILDASDI